MPPITVDGPRPQLVVPFPLRLNPHLADARARDMLWAKETGLVSSVDDEYRYCSWDLAALVAGWLPDAPADGLDLATNAFNWCTVYDDLHAGDRSTDFEYSHSIGKPLLAYLRTGEMPQRPNPLLYSLHDIVEREKHRSPPENHSRITASWALFISATREETQNRKTSRPLTFLEYRDVRRDSGAVHLMTDLIEIANGYHTTSHARALPAVRSLFDSANDAICFINDLYSYPKEEIAGDQHNIIFALQNEHRCTRTEAIARATEIILDECDNMLLQQSYLRKSSRESGLNPQETTNVQRFSHELIYPIASMVSWQQVSARYTEPDNSLYTSGLAW